MVARAPRQSGIVPIGKVRGVKLQLHWSMFPAFGLFAFTLATGTRRWIVSTDGGVQAVAVWGSEVYFGGHFDHVGTVLRRKLALVNTAGALQTWNSRTNSVAGVFALATNQTKLGAGGAFTTFKGGTISQPHFAQFR